jgi:hypothetical protein
MKTNKELDEIRRRIQESISQAKQQELRDKFGMWAEYIAPDMPPELEDEWWDYILEFERQFENAKVITVRERIGDPPLTPLSELPLYAVGAAIEDFLDLLAEFWIAVEFLGEWDDLDAYAYLTGEFLDEETTDVQIEEMWSVFTPSTLEYDVQMWVENFVMDLFTQERSYFLSGLDKQPLFDMQGEPITAVQFRRQIEQVWQCLPAINRHSVEPVTVRVEGETGWVTAVVSWRNDKQEILGQVESFFCLQPSPYTGWDVVQTSLLDDLLAVLR